MRTIIVLTVGRKEERDEVTIERATRRRLSLSPGTDRAPPRRSLSC